ncbi:hypothetical protein ACOME3_008318 [Neoechinorhynchus agilis]
MARFRATTWDPEMIVAQIAFFQFFYYACLTAIMAAVSFLMPSFKETLNVGTVFTPHQSPFIVILSTTLSSFPCALGLLFAVGRYKQCLDFTLTCEIIHLLLTAFYCHQIPRHLAWWASQLVFVTITTFLAEYLCKL